MPLPFIPGLPVIFLIMWSPPILFPAVDRVVAGLLVVLVANVVVVLADVVGNLKNSSWLFRVARKNDYKNSRCLD